MTRRTIRTAATCSVFALATALAAAPAAAQSFQGSSTVVFGGASVIQGSGTTNVDVTTPSAVIDWTPSDTAISNGAPINFQPAGTTATFNGVNGDFALLNRVVPTDTTRPIVFDGNVISQIQTGAGAVRGGTVFFYSPGGILVGSNAVFDVGNLGLTTAPPVVDASGNWYTGNQVQFAQADSASYVSIQPGAQITASQQGSYVAAFAPHIFQGGTIFTNGQAALVAAEAGTITFSPDGLFNIQVSVGTDGQGGIGIEHTGSTTGGASTGAGDNRRIYMVAVPKNTLLSMTFERGSSVGFDVAGAADTVGNAVVLSAGRNVTGGAIDGGVGIDGGSININDSSTGFTGTGIDFTSAVTGDATDNVSIDVFRQTNFASDATFHADDMAAASVSAIPADSVGSLTVGGNLTLSANRFAPVAGGTGDAGQAFLFVTDGGSADIAGTLSLQSVAAFDTDGDGVVTGGTTQLYLDNGSSLDVTGDLLMNGTASTSGDSSGIAAVGGSSQALLFGASSLSVGGVTRILTYGGAGDNNGQTGFGGDGTGGYSALSVTQGSTATLNELSIAADGLGGADVGAGAGNGLGGSAQITVDGAGSTLTVQQANVTGNANSGELDMLSAEGIGGAATIAGTTAGSGTGGFVTLSGSAGATINLPSVVSGPATLFTARGYGGAVTVSGATGGTGNAGEMSIFLDNATFSVENLVASISGVGGTAAITSGNANGGNAKGGNRYIHIINGSTFTGSIVGGSSGAAGGAGLGTGSGGNADGSTSLTDLLVTDSTYNVHGATVIVGQSAGGNGYDGGDAVAGQTNANFVNSTVNIASGATLSISANAFGGNDIAGDGATGGNAIGGTVYAGFVNSNVSGGGTLQVSAVGQAGDSGATGGAGSGGSASLVLNGSSVSLSDVAVNAEGRGGFIVGNANSSGAAAGSGSGGNAAIDLTNAALVASGTIEVRAEGDGGEVDATGFTGVAGGAAVGGTALLIANSGTNTVTAGDLRVDGSATGGTIFGGVGNGGNATGGLASLHTGNAGVTLTVNAPTTVVADGEAHSAQEGGTGGLGLSGVADVSATAGAALTFNGDLTVEANSEGGDGTTAGAAGVGTAANQAVINADNATITVNGLTFMTANALGGVGDLGGTGVGGAANAGSALALAQNGGTLTFNGSADVDAIATGGASTNGTAGAATGGSALFLATTGGAIASPSATNILTADASAFGGFASGAGTGGAATAGFAGIEADSGATVSIAGSVGVNGDADGGAGVNGGDTFGSIDQLSTVNAFIFARGGGSVSIAGTSGLSAAISGGDGRDGGVGGDATGGATVILAASNTAGTTNSTVTLGDVLAISVASGGLGGNGTVDSLTGNYTSAGGAGGNAVAGEMSALGDAGNGQLVITGSASFESAGEGGAGGDGTVGGAGGNGIGGTINVGTRSGAVTPDNTGSATFADVTVIAAGVGGDGGVGETGVGGDGGNGTNGVAGILVRGSAVAIDTANLIAYGIGGNGGTGATGDGAGGDGIVGDGGGVFLVASSRFNQATDRGSFTGNTISGSAFAFGGSGSTTGASIVGDTALQVLFSGADGDIGQLGFGVTGDTVTATVPDQISLTDATVDVGDFSFSTPNDVVLALDNATLNAANFFLSARALLLPATAPTTAGTLNVSGTQEIVVADGGALQTYANMNVTGPFTLSNTGDITTGSVTATGDIFIDSTGGSVSTGNLSGNIVSLTAGQGVTTGPIVAAGLNVAGSTVTLGNVTSSDFVVIDAATAATAGGIQAQSITVNGGTITANGLWQAPSILLTGTDLNIASTAGLNAGTTGSITIASTNAAGAFIGDGLGSVNGFTLSNGEVGRIAGGAILIAAQDYSDNAVDLTIGDLTIGGTQLGGPSGYIDFAAGDAALSTPSGRIRVNGTITATGLATTNAIVFLADSVEINAATGGIFASGSSGTLGGSIVFDAKNIHVASDDVLLRLRTDPFYAGHVEDLNTPGAINRPDGVLSAYALVFYPRETLFIQNTGTSAAPAGFYGRIDESDIEPPGFSDPTAPDVEVIINGKFQTDTGDVTGQAAYQLVIDNAESTAGFTDTSQINGCSFGSGSCTTFIDNTPPPTNADEITAILTEDQAQKEPFDTDNEEDKEQAEEAARAPIAPPVVLIDSRPLNPDVDVTDPVSGTGNPALIGASIRADAQGEPK